MPWEHLINIAICIFFSCFAIMWYCLHCQLGGVDFKISSFLVEPITPVRSATIIKQLRHLLDMCYNVCMFAEIQTFPPGEIMHNI